jgi:hypothetical protein
MINAKFVSFVKFSNTCRIELAQDEVARLDKLLERGPGLRSPVRFSHSSTLELQFQS